MTYPGRNTPSAIKRQLRQEAGFGCCICGLPIIQYHHIIPWAVEEHFRPEDMMVLCPNDHDMAGKALTEDQQRHHKSRPHNRIEGKVVGTLLMKGKWVGLRLGTNVVVGDKVTFNLNDLEVLKFTVSQDHELQISALIFDRLGNLIATIENNEWVSGDIEPWDIEANWSQLIIRSKSHDVRFVIDASGKNHQLPPRLKGKFFLGGVGFLVTDEWIIADSSSGREAIQFADSCIVNMSFWFVGSERNAGLILRPNKGGDGCQFVGGANSERELYILGKRKMAEIKRNALDLHA